jgi:hypothetical protein
MGFGVAYAGTWSLMFLLFGHHWSILWCSLEFKRKCWQSNMSRKNALFMIIHRLFSQPETCIEFGDFPAARRVWLLKGGAKKDPWKSYPLPLVSSLKLFQRTTCRSNTFHKELLVGIIILLHTVGVGLWWLPTPKWLKQQTGGDLHRVTCWRRGPHWHAWTGAKNPLFGVV